MTQIARRRTLSAATALAVAGILAAACSSGGSSGGGSGSVVIKAQLPPNTGALTAGRDLARIVVPLTRPVLLTGAILVMINVWGDYLWPVIVIQDPSKITVSAGIQQFVASFGLNTSSGGAVFAAFVIATVPMFILVGCTMRYFVSGLTEGASKL